MAIQYINTGSSANAGNGDSLRSAFIKVNNNFAYLSTASFGTGGNGYTGSTGTQGNVGYTGSRGPTGSIDDLSDVSTLNPISNEYLKYVGNTWTNSQLSIVNDPFPTLGGNLNTNGFIIQQTAGFLVVRNTASGISLQGTVTIGSASQNIDGSVYIVRNTHSASVLTQAFTFAQHHSNQDATNFNFYRTRGSSTSSLAVQNGDELAEIAFVGHDGTNPVGAASIVVMVDGNVSTGIVPGRILFNTVGTDGIGATRAEITSSGTWKINKLSSLSTTTSSIVVSTSLVPSADLTYDLGSTSSQWRSLYVGTSTIYLGGNALSILNSTLTVNGMSVQSENLEIDGGYASTDYTAEIIIDGNGA